MSSNTPILLRCHEDGGALVLVAGSQDQIMAVCPICGAGAKAEHVTEYSAGLVPGALTEEQLIEVRRQQLLADE